jgi:hypothetical protein
MPRSRTSALCSPAAWITMMSPVRSEIAQAVTLLGTCSVADIAAVTNRPADTLYVHLEKLVGHRTASTLLRAMERTVRDAAAARALVTRPEGRNISMSYELGRLSPAMFQKLRRHVGAIKALMDQGKRRRTGTLYLTVTIACPVVRRRGAGRTEPGAARATRRPRARPRA